jgi:hypothetical protein
VFLMAEPRRNFSEEELGVAFTSASASSEAGCGVGWQLSLVQAAPLQAAFTHLFCLCLNFCTAAAFHGVGCLCSCALPNLPGRGRGEELRSEWVSCHGLLLTFFSELLSLASHGSQGFCERFMVFMVRDSSTLTLNTFGPSLGKYVVTRDGMGSSSFLPAGGRVPSPPILLRGDHTRTFFLKQESELRCFRGLLSM